VRKRLFGLSWRLVDFRFIRRFVIRIRIEQAGVKRVVQVVEPLCDDRSLTSNVKELFIFGKRQQILWLATKKLTPFTGRELIGKPEGLHSAGVVDEQSPSITVVLFELIETLKEQPRLHAKTTHQCDELLERIKGPKLSAFIDEEQR
jgi:hypothetical protein